MASGGPRAKVPRDDGVLVAATTHNNQQREVTMRDWRKLYWGITGALLGTGILSIDSLGIFLLAAGLALAALGAFVARGRAAWGALMWLGAAPALILLFDILTTPPPCPSGELTISPGQSVAVCGGPLPDLYYQLAIGFGVIALLGVMIPLLLRRVRRAGGRAAA